MRTSAYPVTLRLYVTRRFTQPRLLGIIHIPLCECDGSGKELHMTRSVEPVEQIEDPTEERREKEEPCELLLRLQYISLMVGIILYSLRTLLYSNTTLYYS